MFAITITIIASVFFGILIGLTIGRAFCDWHHKNDKH